jgi:hypothetical protein
VGERLYEIELVFISTLIMMDVHLKDQLFQDISEGSKEFDDPSRRWATGPNLTTAACIQEMSKIYAQMESTLTPFYS